MLTVHNRLGIDILFTGRLQEHVTLTLLCIHLLLNGPFYKKTNSAARLTVAKVGNLIFHTTGGALGSIGLSKRLSLV